MPQISAAPEHDNGRWLVEGLQPANKRQQFKARAPDTGFLVLDCQHAMPAGRPKHESPCMRISVAPHFERQVESRRCKLGGGVSRRWRIGYVRHTAGVLHRALRGSLRYEQPLGSGRDIAANATFAARREVLRCGLDSSHGVVPERAWGGKVASPCVKAFSVTIGNPCCLTLLGRNLILSFLFYQARPTPPLTGGMLGRPCRSLACLGATGTIREGSSVSGGRPRQCRRHSTCAVLDS